MAGNEGDDPRAIVPDRLIATALEFAVGVAAHGARQHPPVPFPPALRRHLSSSRLSATALSAVRSAVDADPAFLAVLAATVRPGSVDDAGMLWIKRSEGWRDRLVEMAAAAAGSAAEPDAAARRADRRREQAERSARDAVAEAASLRAHQAVLAAAGAAAEARADALDAALAGMTAEAERLRAENGRLRAELERAAIDRRAREVALAAAHARADDAEAVRDDVLAARAAGVGADGRTGSTEVVLDGASLLAGELVVQAEATTRLADELRRLALALGRLEPSRRPGAAERPPTRPGRGRRRDRRPVPLPGDVYGRPDQEAAHLARHPGIQVVVDGYNVAKLAWPHLDLAAQRDRGVLACEDVARRFGSRITVVFDGASVQGASASGRRLVNVTYSPEGVDADDVIRAMVEAYPDDVPVLVVTNDQAVVNDVRAMGANVVTSEVFLALSGR